MKDSASKAWFLCGLSATAALFLAGLFLFKPATQEQARSPQTVTNTVTLTFTNTVTNTILSVVTNEVEKLVDKIVMVPAEIPEAYIGYSNIAMSFFQATPVKRPQTLQDLKDFRVVPFLSDEVKQCVSDDEVKAKFELVLRKNHVPVNSGSGNLIAVIGDGFFIKPEQVTLVYSIRTTFSRQVFIYNSSGFHTLFAPTWEGTGQNGSAGRSVVKEAFLKYVESSAEVFANDFLSANPDNK